MCAMVEPDIVHDVEAEYSRNPLWIQTQETCRQYHSAGVSLPIDDSGELILPRYISRTKSGFRIRGRFEGVLVSVTPWSWSQQTTADLGRFLPFTTLLESFAEVITHELNSTSLPIAKATSAWVEDTKHSVYLSQLAEENTDALIVVAAWASYWLQQNVSRQPERIKNRFESVLRAFSNHQQQQPQQAVLPNHQPQQVVCPDDQQQQPQQAVFSNLQQQQPQQAVLPNHQAQQVIFPNHQQQQPQQVAFPSLQPHQPQQAVLPNLQQQQPQQAVLPNHQPQQVVFPNLQPQQAVLPSHHPQQPQQVEAQFVPTSPSAATRYNLVIACSHAGSSTARRAMPASASGLQACRPFSPSYLDMANPDRNILATSYFPLLGSSTSPANGVQPATPGQRQSQGLGAHVTHTNGQMNPSPVQALGWSLPSYASMCNPAQTLSTSEQWPQLPPADTAHRYHPGPIYGLAAGFPPLAGQLGPYLGQDTGMLGTAATPPLPLEQSLTQLDAAQPPLESFSPLDHDQSFHEFVAGNFDCIPQSAEACCRRIVTGLYNAALQGCEALRVAIKTEDDTYMCDVLGAASWNFVKEAFVEKAVGWADPRGRFLSRFSVPMTPDRSTSLGPFWRAEVRLRMTVQELVCVAGCNTHLGPATPFWRVLQRSDPALYASAWRAYGHLQVSQPVSKHRQAAVREHAEPLYRMAYEELYWMSRSEHEQKAWELSRSRHASQVAAFLERIFSNISDHPHLTDNQKEVLTLDIRSIYNQAYGRRHQAASLDLVGCVLREYLPHIGDVTKKTKLRREFRLHDGMYIEVTGQAATTPAGVIKVVNRLYAQPENPAVSEQQEWRDAAFQEAAATHSLIDSDKLKRFLPMSSSTLFTCEHFRNHQAKGLRVEIRSAPFQKGYEWEYRGAVAPLETGTLTITKNDAASVAASKVMTAMQTEIKQFVIVMKAVLEKHELQREKFETRDAEAWYAAMQQGAA